MPLQWHIVDFAVRLAQEDFQEGEDVGVTVAEEATATIVMKVMVITITMIVTAIDQGLIHGPGPDPGRDHGRGPVEGGLVLEVEAAVAHEAEADPVVPGAELDHHDRDLGPDPLLGDDPVQSRLGRDRKLSDLIRDPNNLYRCPNPLLSTLLRQ